MRNKYLILLFLVFAEISYAQCGAERTSVKSLSDPLAKQIDFSKVENSSIEKEISLDEQSGERPRADIESHVLQIEATLFSFGLEGDGDYHLCLKDEKGRTMIAEIPNPKCPEAKKSGHVKEYEDSRLWIDSNIGKARRKFKKCSERVKITGVRMFDTHIHGQTGHAKNDVEIHPVLKIEKFSR